MRAISPDAVGSPAEADRAIKAVRDKVTRHVVSDQIELQLWIARKVSLKLRREHQTREERVHLDAEPSTQFGGAIGQRRGGFAELGE